MSIAALCVIDVYEGVTKNNEISSIACLKLYESCWDRYGGEWRETTRIRNTMYYVVAAYNCICISQNYCDSMFVID